jgi:hypothetical protein
MSSKEQRSFMFPENDRKINSPILQFARLLYTQNQGVANELSLGRQRRK